MRDFKVDVSLREFEQLGSLEFEIFYQHLQEEYPYDPTRPQEQYQSEDEYIAADLVYREQREKEFSRSAWAVCKEACEFKLGNEIYDNTKELAKLRAENEEIIKYKEKYFQTNLCYLALVEMIRYHSESVYDKIFRGKESHLKLLIERQVTQDAYNQLDYEFAIHKIKKLEAENETLKSTLQIKSDEIIRQQIRLANFEADNQKLKKALEFYADEKSQIAPIYEPSGRPGADFTKPYRMDAGKLARQTLSEIENGK